jgi:hypothetical protein
VSAERRLPARRVQAIFAERAVLEAGVPIAFLDSPTLLPYF